MWRTVGFLMSFGVVVELCTLVSFVVIIAGGVQRRVQGWGVVVGVLVFSAFIQGVGMAIVVMQSPNSRATRANSSRPTSSTTTHASSPASASTPPGPCAPPPGRCSSQPPSASQHQHTICPQKATTSLSQKWTLSPTTSESTSIRD